METTDSGQGTAGPPTRSRTSLRSGLLGAVVGVGAVVGGLALLTGGAGAQPILADDATTAVGASEAVVIDGDGEGDHAFGTDVEAELEPYFACVDGVLADNGIDLDAIDEEEPDLTEAQWEAIEEEAADCDDLLPAEVAAEWAELDEAFAAYDACLVDHGLIHGFDEESDEEFGADAESIAFVLIEDEDGATEVEFGAGNGEITLAKVDGEITIATDGDVITETLEWDELDGDLEGEYLDDEAFEVCDDLLDDIEHLEFDHEFDHEFDQDVEHDEAEEPENGQD